MSNTGNLRVTGKRYTDDFKKMLIEVYNSGKPVHELCSEYGVTNPTLYKWLKNPTCSKPKKPIIKIEDIVVNKNNKDIIKLEKELERIKEENEILKKAIAMFAKEEAQY
jgi:transposase